MQSASNPALLQTFGLSLEMQHLSQHIAGSLPIEGAQELHKSGNYSVSHLPPDVLSHLAELRTKLVSAHDLVSESTVLLEFAILR